MSSQKALSASFGIPDFRQPSPPKDDTSVEVLEARMGMNDPAHMALIPVKKDLPPEEYMKEIKDGKTGMFLDFFNAFPSRRKKFENIILPLRQQMAAEIGPLTVCQSIALDLYLITYFEIMTVELSYSGYELTLDQLKPAKKSQVTTYDYVQKHLQSLYNRMNICLDMLIKAEPNHDRRLKIKAAMFGISIEENKSSGQD